MKTPSRIFIWVLCLSIVMSFQYERNINYNYIPEKGFVPNDSVAVAITEAILSPIYGDVIYEFRPFKAVLSADKKVWIVNGTKKKSGHGIIQLGGVPHAEIQKMDCKIIRAYCTK